MARKLDQVLRDIAGNQIMQIAELTALLEAAREDLERVKLALTPEQISTLYPPPKPVEP